MAFLAVSFTMALVVGVVYLIGYSIDKYEKRQAPASVKPKVIGH